MWSINTSVACVVMSFTVLGTLFYIGIVVGGTSSYECPLQTPALIVLRTLRHNRKSQEYKGKGKRVIFQQLQLDQDGPGGPSGHLGRPLD